MNNIFPTCDRERGGKYDMERVEEVKMVPLLRGKRVTGEWENCMCVDDEREDLSSLVKQKC